MMQEMTHEERLLEWVYCHCENVLDYVTVLHQCRYDKEWVYNHLIKEVGFTKETAQDAVDREWLY